MANCIDCGVKLTSKNAHKKKQDSKAFKSRCKSCTNKKRHQAITKLKLKAIDYLGGKCSNCGYDKFYGALDFHHVNPSEKEHSWGTLRNRNWEYIKEELDKCICLCSNCHRELHHQLHLNGTND
jgi:predicted HNH restriction endonuclease